MSSTYTTYPNFELQVTPLIELGLEPSVALAITSVIHSVSNCDEELEGLHEDLIDNIKSLRLSQY
jgi:hypothetical protein